MKHKTVNGWTKDKMLKHFKENFKEHSAKGSNCRYRDGKGNACAVGIFIPDNKYSESFENHVFNNLVCMYPELSYIMPLEDHAMNSLQKVHDNCLEIYKPELKSRLINWIEENVED